MEEQFVPYKLALKLKELGFDKPCFCFYFTPEIDRVGDKILHFIPMGGAISNDFSVNLLLKAYPMYRKYMKMEHQEGYILNSEFAISVPLWQQAFDWFRINHKLDGFVRALDSYGGAYWKVTKLGTKDKIKGYSNFTKDYQDSKIKCLEKLIELCQEQKEDTEQKV